jgi:hypothetical protein
MRLAGVVPLDAMRLACAPVQLSDRQEHAMDCILVRTGSVQPLWAAYKASEKAPQGRTPLVRSLLRHGHTLVLGQLLCLWGARSLVLKARSRHTGEPKQQLVHVSFRT